MADGIANIFSVVWLNIPKKSEAILSRTVLARSQTTLSCGLQYSSGKSTVVTLRSASVMTHTLVSPEEIR
jgi:hypothetical protein